MEAGAL
jgi:hypothetical protein